MNHAERAQSLLDADPVMGRVLRAQEAAKRVEAAARRRANRQRPLFDEPETTVLHDPVPLNRWRRGAELRLSQCMVAGCSTTEDLEQHHVFPTWVAGLVIADVWPIITLCRAHHLLWHQLVDQTA